MDAYKNCRLCPRACGADRTAGQLGFCRMWASPKIARCALHFWEEPVLVGSGGAGAVFFSGCTLQCGYCQNTEISTEGKGRELTTEELRTSLEDLVSQGAACIDLVTPTHFLPHILPALEPKLPVPVVYNCGGYESVDTLKLLEGKVDIYLPDLKYADNALANQLSACKDYAETAKAAILEMFRQVGRPVMENGLLKKGVILRHLVLPGHVENSLAVLDWISETFRPGDILLSLMSQYTPMGRLKDTPPFDRPITEDEYAAVCSWAELCGIETGFLQEISSANQTYVPDWDKIEN